MRDLLEALDADDEIRVNERGKEWGMGSFS